jgi:tetratricopeptide (TPR) repeat protein
MAHDPQQSQQVDFRTDVRRFLAAMTNLVLIVLVLVGALLNGEALALDPFSEGVAAANRGEFERAIALFTKAIQREPSFYAAYANRGSVLFKSGHILRGVLDWHRARELAPPFAYAVFTGYLLQHSSSKNALLNYVLPTELDPDFLASVTMAAAAYQDFGRPESAVTLLKKSVDLTRNPLWKSYFEYWAKSLEESP